jgi:hypothetical protein
MIVNSHKEAATAQVHISTPDQKSSRGTIQFENIAEQLDI